MTHSTTYHCYEKPSDRTLKLSELKIYGSPVFSLNSNHIALSPDGGETMLGLRWRNNSETPLSYRCKSSYKLFM